MSKVFIDSSAFFAIANRKDTHHRSARAIFERLVRDATAELYTTNFVIAEAHALLLNKLGRDEAAQFLREVYGGAIRRVQVTSQIETEARQIVEQQADKMYSLTDATSFAVMRNKHITEAFSFDADFNDFGFAVLQP